MIGKFENNMPTTGYPVKNVFQSSHIRAIVLSDKDYTFSSESDIEDIDVWIQSVKDEDIYPIINTVEVTNLTEPQEYKKSILDYEYPTAPGKYKFKLKAPYYKHYHDVIAGISSTDLRVFLFDVNSGIICNNTSGVYKGLRVEAIHVEKKTIGEAGPAWTEIYLTLSDPDEYNEHHTIDWSSRKLNITHLDITIVSSDDDTLVIDVEDENYGIVIEDIYLNDLSVTDDAGGITVSSISEVSGGRYQVVCSGSLTFGTITINNDNYYGTQGYYVSEVLVSLSNFVWQSDNVFQVDVALSGSGTDYTGLLLADFDVTDDIEGVCTITNVTEVSPGTYELTVTEDLSTGDVDVDDGTVTGTSEYTVSILAEFDSLVVDTSNEITVRLVNSHDSGDEITGTAAEDFTVVDTYNGSITVLSVAENVVLGDTYITLTLNGSVISGLISFDDGIYYKSNETYSNTNATIKNGGASGATDFDDDNADGLADDFTLVNDSDCTADIVTSPTGFTGDVQRIHHDSGTLAVGINVPIDKFKTETDYILRFKYYTQGSGTGADRFTTVSVYGDSVYMNESIEPVTGAYVFLYESDSFQIDDGEDSVLIQWTFNRVGMYLSIDEIEIIEV